MPTGSGHGGGDAADPTVEIVDGDIAEAAEDLRKRKVRAAVDYHRRELEAARGGVARAANRIDVARRRVDEAQAAEVAAVADIERLEAVLADAEAATAALED